MIDILIEKLSALIRGLHELVHEIREDRKERNQTQTILNRINELEKNTMITLSQIKSAVADAAKKNKEAFSEIGTKIADLQKQIADLIAGNSDPTVTDAEFEANLKDLQTSATELADIVPGSPSNPPAPVVLSQSQIDALAAAALPLTDDQITANTAGTGPTLTPEQTAALVAAGIPAV